MIISTIFLKIYLFMKEIKMDKGNRHKYTCQELSSNLCVSEVQHEFKNNEEFPFWCVECDKYLKFKCNIHTIKSIADKPIRNKQFASIPTEYLCIKVIDNKKKINGIFTRKTVPRRVKFGPVEGCFVEGEPPYSKSFFVKINSIQGYLDTSNEAQSNWMKFVRWAKSFNEMNCAVIEEDNSIYFLTTVDIPKKTELKIGYSKHYSMKYGLQYLKLPEKNILDLDLLGKSWRCSECTETFKSSDVLKKHLILHRKNETNKNKKKVNTQKILRKDESLKLEGNVTENTLHECDICFLCFPTINLLLLHMELHEAKYSNRKLCEEKKVDTSCPTCNEMFKNRNALSHHVNNHSMMKINMPLRNFKCNLCYKSFESKDKLETHNVTHVSKPNTEFPCNHCICTFSNYQSLTSHQKVHKESSLGYVCPMCNKKFDSLRLMKIHIPEHQINGVYICPYCHKTYTFYHKIRRHIRTYHPDTLHPCQVCGKTLSSLDKLRLHMLSHSDKRDFICDVCKRAFKRKDKLKDHQKRGHTNIRVRVEDKARILDLRMYKYKCKMCIRGFKRRGMLVNHLSKRHPNIPLDSVPELVEPIMKECRIFFCHYCNKTYETSSKRKIHILKHHPGAALTPITTEGDTEKVCNTIVLTPKKSFAVSCSYCPRQYATNAKLLQHLRKCHKKEMNKKSKAKKVYPQPKPSQVIVTSSFQENAQDNSQLIRLNPLNPSMHIQLRDVNSFVDGEEMYVNVQSSQPVILEGDFNDQTLAVLAPNSDDSFCIPLRTDQVISNIGVLCQSDIPYVTTSSKNVDIVGQDNFKEDQVTFDTGGAKDDCILTQVDPNSSVLLWQTGIFSNVN